MAGGSRICAGYDRRVSAMAGTIFDKTRTPLTVWFATAWRMVGDKVGVSATQVQREMELGSYQTAWVMLHRYRSVMVRPGRDRLRGDVEVDESFLGGPEPGVPGRGALGKVLFAGAVELDESGFGRARLGVIPNASAVSLAAFLAVNVEPGSCHHQRHSRRRGLLFHTLLRQTVDGQPVTYRSLRKTGRTRPAPPPAHGLRRHPQSLDVGRPELLGAVSLPSHVPNPQGYVGGNPLCNRSVDSR